MQKRKRLAPTPVTRRGCALVTGGSRGIGAAIARGLAADGWAVGVNYRADADAAAEVVDTIRTAGGLAMPIKADVRDADAPDTLLTAAQEQFGLPVLMLANNAGIVRDGLVAQLGDDSWDAVLETNLTAAFRLTRSALRGMMRARFGRIVNIASLAACVPGPGQASYAASKAGLVALTQVVAREVARFDITVNALAPGLIETDATQAVIARLVEHVPSRRCGTPEEVAECVRFLASEKSSYVTGSVLRVDGGLIA
jgi:3-oxoacyl-[acyl-carrier protein] reductase